MVCRVIIIIILIIIGVCKPRVVLVGSLVLVLVVLVVFVVFGMGVWLLGVEGGKGWGNARCVVCRVCKDGGVAQIPEQRLNLSRS